MQNKTSLSAQNSTTVRSIKMVAGGWWLSALARLSPERAGRTALRLFGTPPPPRPVARGAEPVLARARRFSVEIEDATVQGYVWGAGPTAYLVHGWGGRASQLTALVEPLLERGLRVVAFDAPAHGSSTGEETTLFGFASTLRTIVALDGGDPYAFIGHSLGAAAALFAASDDLAPARVVLVAPPSDPARYVGYFVERLGATPAVEHALRNALVARYSLDGSGVTLAHQAERVRSPLLVVHDHEDLEIPWRHGAALARAWSRARLVSTRGLGHNRILRDPCVVDTIARFLDRDPVSEGDAESIGEPAPETIDGICSIRSCTRVALDDDLCLEHLLSYEAAHPHTRWPHGALERAA